ncbi:hypothetical protein ColTof4_03835 [Colletotrichum tofieldiae]|nr:hypothetical protein ColTof3_12740 [Colletotrichum tofieldiae]GKT71412.1 hypothetical protein ColTof4_03835 [Colletotrichum tofieldiae]GKT93658.1 hypothetical protein Ct61P_11508 [Colletotrichum tofieldiae]
MVAPCYATYTPAAGNPSTVSDHGFRVLSDDPLFQDHNWPAQTYREDPLTQANRPTSVNSANWVKRTEVFQYTAMTLTATTFPAAPVKTVEALTTSTTTRKRGSRL